jgi:hypothetical protein
MKDKTFQNRILCSLLLFSCVTIANYPAFAKNQPEFETAKVISQDIQSHEVDKGAMTRTAEFYTRCLTAP